MTYKEINTMVKSMGFPYAYYQFKQDTAKPCPFITFFYEDNNDVFADNSNYQTVKRLYVELCTDDKDFSAEAVVESVLAAHGMAWSCEETYIDPESMHMTIYSMDVVITEEVT